MVDMEVQHIEIVEPTVDLVDHHDMVGHHVTDPRIQSECGFRARHQRRGCDRVSARKQRHFVAQSHQLFGEVGGALKLGRAAFRERRYLSDFHFPPAPNFR
jgi:hypothetical protein